VVCANSVAAGIDLRGFTIKLPVRIRTYWSASNLPPQEQGDVSSHPAPHRSRPIPPGHRARIRFAWARTLRGRTRWFDKRWLNRILFCSKRSCERTQPNLPGNIERITFVREELPAEQGEEFICAATATLPEQRSLYLVHGRYLNMYNDSSAQVFPSSIHCRD
jgi:hypothetical protein